MVGSTSHLCQIIVEFSVALFTACQVIQIETCFTALPYPSKKKTNHSDVSVYSQAFQKYIVFF